MIEPTVMAAMRFALVAHGDQKRKYTGEPYFVHLLEVYNLVAVYFPNDVHIQCAALLHDVLEDTPTSPETLQNTFGKVISDMVVALTDCGHESGNRAQRKEIDRTRLSAAGHWVQSIKCADVISNTSTIAQYDQKFARIYLVEKRALLDVMHFAHPELKRMAEEAYRAAALQVWK